MEDKVKIEMEFVIQASPQLLYQYISTPSGLSEWFADNVNSRGELFTFIWDGSEETAKLLSKKSGERIKFRWLSDDEDGTSNYFELKIQVDEITKDIAKAKTVVVFMPADAIKNQKHHNTSHITVTDVVTEPVFQVVGA